MGRYAEILIKPEGREHWKDFRERFFLIRHGRTSWNEQGLLQGSTDIPLLQAEIENIRRQAAELRDSIHNQFADLPWVIVCSPLSRALATARIYGEIFGVDPVVDDRFREFNFGKWEGRPIDELKKDASHQDFLKNPIQASFANIPPEGEVFLDFLQRVFSGMQDLMLSYEREGVLLITHAGVIRAAHMFNWAVEESIESLRELDGSRFFYDERGAFIKIPHDSPVRF